MDKLNNNSLVFMTSLIDNMIDDIDCTIYSTNDQEYLDILDYSKSKLLLVFTRLNNYIIKKGISTK